MKRKSLWLLVLLTVPAVGSQPVLRQKGTPHCITLQLVDQESSPTTVIVRDGGLASYENRRFGVKFGIVPQVVDAAAGDVELTVVSVVGEAGAYEQGRSLETLRAKVGFRSVTAAIGPWPVDLNVVKIGDEWGENDRTDAMCGVACGSVFVQGLIVKSECGSCG